MSDTVKVFVEEEYGYRYWMWDTGMTSEALIAWWKALPSVQPYFFSPAGLPGKMGEIAMTVKRHPTAKDYDAFNARLAFAQVEARGWSLHIHQDNDSGLQGPDGEAYTHAGFVPINFNREASS